MARKSDTAALVGRGLEVGSETTVRVRKIANGYVKSVSKYGPNGDYSCSETFSEGLPGDEMPFDSPSSLSDAVGYLKGGL